MNLFIKRTWLEIDLDAIQDNFLQIRSRLRPETKMIAVVKADAYGHGDAYTAAEMVQAGADWLAVSNLEEAMHLRQLGMDRPLLILGYTPPACAAQLALNHISQAVFCREYAQALSHEAERMGVQVNIHIKLDTGMSRIGYFFQDNVEDGNSLEDIRQSCQMANLYAEGIFTHFASADEGQDGEAFTRLQYDLFLDAVRRLEEAGIHFSLRHCCNSAGIMDYPEMQLDAVRPGIILYGLMPGEQVKAPLPLRPAMEMKSVISMVKTVEQGTPVSYGRTFTAPQSMRIATVPVGYADGYPRVLSGKAWMLVDGKRAPVIGRVCMDQLMLDVTAIPAACAGMTVTVFGRDKGACLPVDQLAEWAGTIHYEVVCGISKRVPRLYKKGTEYVGQVDYIL